MPAALLRACLIVSVLVSMLSCAKDDPVVEELVIPVVFSLSDTELSPGDTLTIVGEKFATPASNNRIVFNNELAIPRPFYATADTIQVEVPTNATTGPMYVTSLGVRSNETVLEITHGVGDVWVVGEGSFGYKAEKTKCEVSTTVEHSWAGKESVSRVMPPISAISLLPSSLRLHLPC